MRSSLYISLVAVAGTLSALAQPTRPQQGSLEHEFNKWVQLPDASFTLQQLLATGCAPWFSIPSTDEWRITGKRSNVEGLVDIRLGQFRLGIPIEHAELRVHTDDNGVVIRINGSCATAGPVVQPSRTYDQCAQAAIQKLTSSAAPLAAAGSYRVARSKTGLGELMYTQLDLEEPLANAKLALCYHFVVQADEPSTAHRVYVDANNGTIIRNVAPHRGDCHEGWALTRYNDYRSIITKHRWFSDDFVTIDECRGDGIISWDQGLVPIDDSDNSWSLYEEQPITSALWAGEMTYDYWSSVHGRNSWDAVDGLIRIRARDNAFGANNCTWNGQDETIYCGTGGGDGYQFAFVALENIGHEFTHAISGMECGWSNSVSMETQALDESFSDAFGVMVDFNIPSSTGNYLIGELNGFSGGVRNMADPNARFQPDTYQGDYWSYSTDADEASYTNMGVPSRWYYLLAEGGFGTNDNGFEYEVEGIGRLWASRIVYRAMSAYLTSSSQFADAKNATIYSAIDWFGDCSWAVAQTINAWNAVGVETASGWGADGEVDCALLVNQHNAGMECTRRAIDDLSADCSLAANGVKVNFYGGESITLLAGFNSGNAFLAQIDACLAQARSALSTSEDFVDHEELDRKDMISDGVSPAISTDLMINAYPNPSSSLVYISVVGDKFEPSAKWFLEVIDSMGRVVAQSVESRSRVVLNLEAQSGLLLLRATQGTSKDDARVLIE